VRVLFVAPRFPYPPRQGDRLRAYELLRRLNQRHTVTLVAPDQPDAERHTSNLCSSWHPIKANRWPALARLAAALPTQLPLQVAYSCPPAFRTIVQGLLAEESFDLVHLHTARVGPVLEDAQAAGVPAVIDLIDALSLNMHRRAERELPPLRWLFASEASRMAHYEQHLLSHAAGASVVAAADKAALGSHPQLRVVPMGIDLATFACVDQPRDPATIVLSGRMGYFPNADAAHFLATEIMPLVRARLPQATLQIIGADPPRSVQRLAQLPGVTVTGFVPDLAAALQRATVAVAPMRAGTGMQIKVLEAMACGLPVVATPQVLAGVAGQTGHHALHGETANELAMAIVRLIEQPNLRSQLAHAARRLVEELYPWEQVATQLEDLYRSALAGHIGASQLASGPSYAESSSALSGKI
jgi:sugar transferase (PEP-CTERM/EpsH1 system associated)